MLNGGSEFEVSGTKSYGKASTSSHPEQKEVLRLVGEVRDVGSKGGEGSQEKSEID